MAELFKIMKITVGEEKLTARVLVNPGMPLRTAEDIEATARVYYLAPAIAKHVCLGDAGSEFQDCMGDTELAHLLEHLTVELMNETGLAGDISCGRTRGIAEDPRLFDIELSCPDDVLTIGALSSAVFMMQWAFVQPDAPAPDVEGTVEGLRRLVLSLRGEDATEVADGDDADIDDAAADDAAGGPEEDAAADVDGDDAVDGPIDVEGARVEEDAPADPVFGGAAAGYEG